MLCRVALARADVYEEPSESIIRVTGIDELGKTLELTRNGQSISYQIASIAS
jgi:hypothetical protein